MFCVLYELNKTSQQWKLCFFKRKARRKGFSRKIQVYRKIMPISPFLDLMKKNQILGYIAYAKHRFQHNNPIIFSKITQLLVHLTFGRVQGPGNSIYWFIFVRTKLRNNIYSNFQYQAKNKLGTFYECTYLKNHIPVWNVCHCKLQQKETTTKWEMLKIV